MLASSSSSRDYVSIRHHARSRHYTPPRHSQSNQTLYDSPMLTPSPLRQRLFVQNNFSENLHDTDDLFMQSPYKPPASTYNTKPQSITLDDEDGSIFRSPSSVLPPFFPTSDSQPLRTPVKQIHRTCSRPALYANHPSASADRDSEAQSPVTRVGVGTKRKSTPHTPLRQHNLTPLVVTSGSRSAAGVVLDRLAPLPAPKFATGTPHTKAETDAYLQRQTASLTSLRITDLDDSGDELGGLDNDSGCELDDDDEGDVLFTGSVRLKGQVAALGKPSRRVSPVSKSEGKGKDEVVEAISPGGHVTKRRARSRPLSAELLESVQRSPSSQNKYATSSAGARQRTDGIAFPSVPSSRKWASSGTTVESGLPLPRRRVTHIHPQPHPPRLESLSRPMTPRTPMFRQDSAASLFFGPSIPPLNNPVPAARSRTSSTLSSFPPSPQMGGLRPKMANRHSYAGPDTGTCDVGAWNTIQTRSQSPSPGTSPQVPICENSGFDDVYENMLFGDGPPDSSFIFSVTEGTPSPRSKKSSTASLPSKYKPRDSGVVMSDDDDHSMSTNDHLTVPAASTSANSLQSDEEDSLITPGIGPDSSSGWPKVFITGTDDVGGRDLRPSSRDELDVDTFIMRTLAAASKGPEDGKKKVPGTPVKRAKVAYLTERPWQSAVAAKIDREDWDVKQGKAPRKSLPAAFPGLGQRAGKLTLDHGTDSEDEEDSPSNRRNKYAGLGLGRPSASTPQNGLPLMSRTRWLMRRSSSGAFSSGSDSQSSVATPTRVKGKDWQLPCVPVQFSPSENALRLSPARSTGSLINRGVKVKPTGIPSLPVSSIPRLHPRHAANTRRQSEPFAEQQPSRFERDFVEVGEIGSGEFGKVIKVRRKDGNNAEVYAIKKSKRFEGMRHRLRLREEVEVLRHLSQVSGEERHPNVLAYIDSWEEDEALYIQTELCESGNLARFLWEYGRVFPKLDEGRVWKIVVDLSNGLRFIHDAGVIHLDLKPSNVFLTREGRFKIGDFGMASLWPRPDPETSSAGTVFEREGDKLYLAPEVLQGKYSKAADVFSLGMTILETASNIVVPDQGEAWHRLRREDFSQVDLGDSPELLDLIRHMMRSEPSLRMSVQAICDHPVVSRARIIMERVYIAAKRDGSNIFAASPLASVHGSFLEEILDDGTCMDLSP